MKKRARELRNTRGFVLTEWAEKIGHFNNFYLPYKMVGDGKKSCDKQLGWSQPPYIGTRQVVVK